MKLGRLKKAENAFRQALRLNPNYREATLNLGLLYVEMRRFKQGEQLLLAAVKKVPGDGLLRHILGVFFLQTGRQKAAVRHIRKAIQLDSRYAELYRRSGAWKRGTVCHDRKSEERIGRIPLNYHHAHLHSFVGLYLSREGRPRRAIREIRKALELKSDEWLFHAHLGFVYYQEGHYRKAVQEYTRTLKMNPSYGMGFANLSYVYGAMGRTREALKHMKRAVTINPRFADLRYNLALLYSDHRRPREAVAELKKALRINPNYILARIYLGVLFEEQMRWKEARREYEKILRITPEDTHVRQRLERISRTVRI
jgi:tetratricopeptide (TPR) repeat protein